MKSPRKLNRNPSSAGNTRRARRRKSSPADRAKLLELVRRSLDDDMADDVAVIDLQGKTTIADHMVVASGRNARHIGAMADHLKEKIKAAGLPSPPIEGESASDWVLIDGGDVIVHLFRPETRALYNLEKMWGGEWTDPNSDSGDEDTDGSSPSATADT